ncbi:hypothetical protein B0H16DRAFT_1554029 [Mycena metata]|uniref:Uncharacterized protein n=1 Tax=Mycena metata TaxID=1033252 RepID=A0AAD7IRK0_9AGAR|nr:hypothetical protein B0H16DRAFT_1554029 [Mycena metata]
MVDTDNAKSKREFKKLSKCMGDKLDKEKGRWVSFLAVFGAVLLGAFFKKNTESSCHLALLPTEHTTLLLRRAAGGFARV